MKNRRETIVPGLVLIFLGLFFLLQRLAPGVLAWGNVWPILPTLSGLGALAGWLLSEDREPGILFLGTAATLVGLFFFLFTFDYYEWSDMSRLWPAFPIIGGLAFLAMFVGGRFRDWGAAGVGCVAIVVGVVAFGFTLFRLPRNLADTLVRLWPLGLIFIGLIGLASAFLRRGD
jgi:hypothetical protein